MRPRKIAVVLAGAAVLALSVTTLTQVVAKLGDSGNLPVWFVLPPHCAVRISHWPLQFSFGFGGSDDYYLRLSSTDDPHVTAVGLYRALRKAAGSISPPRAMTSEDLQEHNGHDGWLQNYMLPLSSTYGAEIMRSTGSTEEVIITISPAGKGCTVEMIEYSVFG